MTVMNAAEPQLTPKARGRMAARRAVALVLLLLLLRIPLLDHPTPVTEDEAYFMAGLGFPAQYPVHHPGYPLWVAMGTLLNQLGCEPYRSFQLWSLLASLAAPLLFYAGLRRVIDDMTAWWLAMALGVNPLVWFQSTTALSYMSAGALGLLIVGLCYRASVEDRRSAMYGAAVLLAIGIFLRVDLLFFLGPAVAYAAWRHRKCGGWTAVAIVAGGCAVLFGVTAFLYGRADMTQMHPELSHTRNVVLGTSVFRLGFVDGLLRNATKVVMNVGWDLGPATTLLPWAAWRVWRTRGQFRRAVPFLLLWVVPAATFLLLMHVVQGYFMPLLPAAYCAIGLALQASPRRSSATRVAAAVALCSILQFTLYPWSAESRGFKRLLDAKIAFQSAVGLRHIDRLPEIHQPGDFWRTAAYDQVGEPTKSQPSEPVRGE